MDQAPKKAVKILGGFELLTRIGQGGMGAVFKARQISLDRIVALKVLPPKIAKKDPQFIDRFIREARVSAQLNHPHVVQGIEVGKDEATGLYYFAMEYIDGPTVMQILKRERIVEERRALEIALGVAQALVAAHKAGIVHRDVKPDNILLTSRGEAKLADLGLAKRVAAGEEAGAEGDKEEGLDVLGPSADAALTQAGKALGTPYYMAPEQVEGKQDQIDIRADLYALGATLFHMVTGQPPFGGSGFSSTKIMQARLTSAVPDARKVNPKLSEATHRIIFRLMQKAPAQRFQSPEELAREISSVLRDTQALERRATARGLASVDRSRARRERGEGADARRSTSPKGEAQSSHAYLAAGVCLIILLGAGGVLLSRKSGEEKAASNPSVPRVELPAEKSPPASAAVEAKKTAPERKTPEPVAAAKTEAAKKRRSLSRRRGSLGAGSCCASSRDSGKIRRARACGASSSRAAGGGKPGLTGTGKGGGSAEGAERSGASGGRGAQGGRKASR